MRTDNIITSDEVRQEIQNITTKLESGKITLEMLQMWGFKWMSY